MRNIRIIYIVLFALVVLSLSACGDDENDIDKEQPVIDLTIKDAFPVNCDTLYFGESFELKVHFSDNYGLGSYSVDIHNNFDHHSHSTEVIECDLEPVKTPVNPFSLIDDYEIPGGLADYDTNLKITLPSGNDNGLFDDGDYHFFLSLTDQEGWSDQKGLSIKVMHR